MLDQLLRNLLFARFRIGKIHFDFLEGLLAVCITGVGFMLRTPFETGLPHWPYLIAEWYLAVVTAVLVWNYTSSRKKTLGTYAILMILPTIIADGTILRGDACVGALLFVSALLFFVYGKKWAFTAVMAAALLLSVKYIGIVFAAMVLWKNEKLKFEQLLVLMLTGIARFVLAYRAWLTAGYTLVTFHWPNIYEIVGKAAVTTQLIDPIALVGLFLSLGLLILAVYLLCQETFSERAETFLRLLLFFGLVAGYFLPYMDQSYGYLFCILGVVYFMLVKEQFFVPMLLQIVTFVGYQECLNGETMMSMVIFSVIQFLLMAYLGLQLLEEAGVVSLCKKN